jgi:hypothetical protein
MIDFQTIVRPDEKRAGGSQVEKARIHPGRFEHLLGEAKTPRSCHRYGCGNAEPEQGEARDREIDYAKSAHACAFTPSRDSYGEAVQRKGRVGAAIETKLCCLADTPDDVRRRIVAMR